jgi:hypothetical protein
MSEHVLRTTEVRNVKFEISVDDRTGQFIARADGFTDARGTTLEALTDQLKVKTSQARVKTRIPFSRTVYDWKTGKDVIRHGTATGIHAQNGSVLVSWDDGGTSQLPRYNPGITTRPLDKDAETRWLDLSFKVKAAKTALEAFEAAHKIDLLTEVEAEIAKQMREASDA